MCQFCTPANKTEELDYMSREIMSRPIDIGKLSGALRLELWYLRDREEDITDKLEIAIGALDGLDYIANETININYCPMCGKKLKEF